MYTIDGIDHRSRARNLVQSLVDEQDHKYGVGSMTISLYDTAWLSMVRKLGEEHSDWLSPESFQYLLDTQHLDGGWHSTNFQIDGILSTLAALLALCKHIAIPDQLSPEMREDLFHRRNRAIYYLDENLSQWDITSTISSGFELLVPKHLELLSAEGVDFNFPGLHTLCELKTRSSARFNPAALYTVLRSSTAQYLEGFIGEVDFSKMSPHKISGSIMASPASTSAYLIHSNTWDAECEEYLLHVLSLQPDDQKGAVPSQYPTTVFEVTECLSALTSSGLTPDQLGSNSMDDFADFLESCLSIDGGASGSAPYIESDADSTAKVISTLCQLGRVPSPQGMIIRFEMRDCFKTFTHERKPRLRTNCLVLKALLDLARNGSEHDAHIEKTVNFIINYWWTTNGEIREFSNLAANYPLMLIADAFFNLLDLWDKGLAPLSGNRIIRDKVYICLYQVLIRTLQTQNPDGSWGWSTTCENTAYAVLTLTKLAAFTSAPRVRIQITQAVENAKEFIAHHFVPDGQFEYLWCGKTIAGSKKVNESYILAALEAPLSILSGDPVETRYEMSMSRMAIQTKYFARQAWFTLMPEWQIQACLVESQLFLPQLRAMRHSIFTQDQLQQDQYFETIPFMWLAANEFYRRLIGPEYLYQMMIVSILNRQFDDYIKHRISETFTGCLFEVEDVIQNIFDQVKTAEGKDCYSEIFNPTSSRNSASTTATAAIHEVHTSLSRFITFVLNHPYARMASQDDQSTLSSELLTFMKSQIYKPTDSDPTAKVRASKVVKASESNMQHCYTFAFLACLVGNQRIFVESETQLDFLESSEQKYLANSMCQHMSTVDSLASKAPLPPLSHRQLSPGMYNRSRFGTQRGHSSSVSSLSTATSSSFSTGGVSPASFLSSNSSVPGVSPLSDRFQGNSKEQSPAPNDAYQYLRLLHHERRCLEVCIQDLVAAGISQRTASIVGLYSDTGELSAQIFNDPNVGSYYQPNTVNEIIEQVEAFELSSCRPLKSARRGSVSRARANLKLEPARPKHIFSLKKSQELINGKNADMTVMPLSPKSQPPPDVIVEIERPALNRNPPSSAPPHISQFDFDFPVPAQPTRHRSPSDSSVEVTRIEQVMSKMGEGEIKHSKPATQVFREVLPKPKVNPMLKDTQHTRTQSNAAAVSIYNLPADMSGEALNRFNSTPALSRIESHATRRAKARLQTQRKIRDQLDQELKKANETKAKEHKRPLKKSITLPTPFMLAAATSVSAPPTPRLVNKRKKAAMQRVRFQEDEKEHRRLEAHGWIKSPSAEKLASFMDIDSDGGEGRRGRLMRNRKTAGPKLKLPF